MTDAVVTVLETLAVILVAAGVGVVVAGVVSGAVGIGAGMVAAGVVSLLGAWLAAKL